MPIVRVNDNGKKKNDNKFAGVVSGAISLGTVPLYILGWMTADVAIYACILSTSLLCAYNSYDD
jgi:hypothetical protein